jgi:thioester reductase-like protein
MARGDVVLLTGYPSLVARAVCAELLARDPKGSVVAVLRAKFLSDAQAARQDLPPGARDRLHFLEGDAAAIDLGLSGVEWKKLARDVTRIHHCAEVTYLGVDRKTAERANVDGAFEVLELARACGKLQALVLHSTAHVSGNRRGIVLEDELEAGQAFRTVVEETKARAERLARAAMTGLPIVVVRPSIIVGDSRTGEVDRLDGPYLLVLLVVTSPPELALPLPGRGDEPLNLVPVDWVARAAVALGREPSARGKTFHLVDPEPLSTRRVFELVARAGGRRGPRGSIPTNLAKALLRAPGLDRIAKSPRAFLETLTTPVIHDSRNTASLLPTLDIPACPPFETYVDKLVAFVKERVRQRRASREAELEVADPLE